MVRWVAILAIQSSEEEKECSWPPMGAEEGDVAVLKAAVVVGGRRRRGIRLLGIPTNDRRADLTSLPPFQRIDRLNLPISVTGKISGKAAAGCSLLVKEGLDVNIEYRKKVGVLGFSVSPTLPPSHSWVKLIYLSIF